MKVKIWAVNADTKYFGRVARVIWRNHGFVQVMIDGQTLHFRDYEVSEVK